MGTRLATDKFHDNRFTTMLAETMVDNGTAAKHTLVEMH